MTISATRHEFIKTAIATVGGTVLFKNRGSRKLQLAESYGVKVVTPAKIKSLPSGYYTGRIVIFANWRGRQGKVRQITAHDKNGKLTLAGGGTLILDPPKIWDSFVII